MKNFVHHVAMVAHEVNAAYCRSIGDFSHRSWDESDEWQRQSVIAEVEFHLKALREGFPVGPSASHAAWVKNKVASGWTHGAEKDAEIKQHPLLLPYVDLPVEHQMKDYLFGNVVKAFYDCYAGRNG